MLYYISSPKTKERLIDNKLERFGIVPFTYEDEEGETVYFMEKMRGFASFNNAYIAVDLMDYICEFDEFDNYTIPLRSRIGRLSRSEALRLLRYNAYEKARLDRDAWRADWEEDFEKELCKAERGTLYFT